jgi:hypothetical protein
LPFVSLVRATALLCLLLAACDRRPQAPALAADAAEEERLAKLSALGYLGSVAEDRRPGKTGVVAHDRAHTLPGVTVFGNRHGSPTAYHFDRDGRELVRYATRPERGNSLLWMEPTRDGHLLVLGRRYLMKSTWTGEKLWEAERRQFHHGFDQGSDGTIYALAHGRRRIEVGGSEVPILDDQIVVLSPEGETLRTISILDLLGTSAIAPRLLELAAARREARPGSDPELEEELKVDNPYDVFHLNAVQVLERDLGVARAGDLLVCLRSLDLVLAIALDPVGVRWRWEAGRALLDRPHAPTELANGNLLIFDNGWSRGFSRLIELDPRRDEIVWQYVADPPQSFYTRRGGYAQVLANGNLLVTQTDAGRVFEVTRAGELVWDFWNPIFDRDSAGGPPQRRTIYRAWRWDAGDLGDAAPRALRAALAPPE